MNAIRKPNSPPTRLPPGLTRASLNASPARVEETSPASASVANGNAARMGEQAGHALKNSSRHPSWAARKAVTAMRELALADLIARRDSVKAQAARIGNFRPEDEAELSRLMEERITLDARIDRAMTPGRPWARGEA